MTRATDPAVALDDGDHDCRQGGDNDTSGGNEVGEQEEISGFDEFVLCSVFRPRDSASREEDTKS